MRQTASPWLMCSWMFVLLVGPSAHAEPESDFSRLPELTRSNDVPAVVQLIGWSQDEQRYAFRVFFSPSLDWVDEGAQEDGQDSQAKGKGTARRNKDGFCPGYLDAQGKPFKGELLLVAFEGTERRLSIPIQDGSSCTSPKVAAARLTKAKAQLATLGIDLKRTGQDLPLVSGKSLSITPSKSPPYTLELLDGIERTEVYKPGTKDEFEKYHRHGVLELKLHRGDKTRTVFTHKVDETFTDSEDVNEEERLMSVHVSPSGERGVVVGYNRSGPYRSFFVVRTVLAAVWGWPEGSSTQEK